MPNHLVSIKTNEFKELHWSFVVVNNTVYYTGLCIVEVVNTLFGVAHFQFRLQRVKMSHGAYFNLTEN